METAVAMTKAVVAQVVFRELLPWQGTCGAGRVGRAALQSVRCNRFNNVCYEGVEETK